MTKYLVKGDYQDEKEVPDPFHGGPENFEKVRFAIHIANLHSMVAMRMLLFVCYIKGST